MGNLLVVGEKERHHSVEVVMREYRDYTCKYVLTAEEEVGSADVIVCLGRIPAQKVLGRPVKVTEEVGKVYETDRGKVLIQFAPSYVQRQMEMEGGAGEKTEMLWFDVWDQVGEVLTGEKIEPPKVYAVTKLDRILDVLEAARESGFVAYDYEAWGSRDARRPELNTEYRIVTIGLAFKQEGEVVACAFPFDYPGVWKTSEYEQIKAAWFEVMEGDSVAHYAKYEHKANLKVFHRSNPRLHDTYLADAMIDELKDHDLYRCMQRYGIRWYGYKSEDDEVRKAPMDFPMKRLLRYNALDAYATLEIWDAVSERLAKDDMEGVLELEESFCYYIAKMEMAGIAVDDDAAIEVRREVEAESARIADELWAMPEIKKVEKWAERNIGSFGPGDRFNPKSPKQMAYLCTKVLKLKTREKTKTGGIKLDKTVLEKFEKQVPVLAKLNAYRSAQAMVTGFLDKWDQYVSPSGCVHTSYNQARVVTGRLSSSDPNLQNIPGGSPVKKVFTSRWGKEGLLISADYKQQEPRIIAGWSGDRRMIEALAGGLDPHTFVASMIYDVDYDDVTKDQRHVGKRMGLGLAYGQTEYGLSQKTGISVEEAVRVMRKFDRAFPDIRAWINQFHRDAMRNGYVEDLFGSRRHLPNARSSNPAARSRALRQAGNYPIQRTAYMFAMIGLSVVSENLGMFADVVGMVHDSIVVDCINHMLDRKLKLTKEGMLIHNQATYWGHLGVPMEVDFKVGPNLHEMEEIDVDW